MTERKTATIIQMVFDGILMLFKLPMNPVKATKLTVASLGTST